MVELDPHRCLVQNGTGASTDTGASAVEVLLGIDVGTAATKAGLYGSDGKEIASAEVPTTWTDTASGGEIDPEAFVRAAVSASKQALARAPGRRVVSLGVTSMAETGVMVSNEDRPIGPSIAWYDTRTLEAASDLGVSLGHTWFSETTGLILRPRVTAAHVRWMMDNELDSRGASSWLGVAEWVAFRLGASRVADLSLAARTGFLDVTTRAWLPEVAEWANAPDDLLPELVRSGEALGRVGQEWDELAGSVITTAGHDKLCAAIGAGVIADDDTYNSCGTAEALVTSTQPFLDRATIGRAVEAGLAVGWHVYPDRQSVLGGLNTGRSLNRVLEFLGVGDTERSELDKAALARPEGRMVEIDGLMSERVTLKVAGWGYQPADLWASAVSTAAREAAALLASLEEVVGPRARVIVSGGWASSETFMAAKRKELGPVERSSVRRPGTRGAAMIAGVAAGWWSFADIPAVASSERSVE